MKLNLVSTFLENRIFNLLKPIVPPTTIWDKIYLWIVSRARIIILIAEVLIVIAFFSKVVIDTQAKNKQRQIDRLIQESNLYAATVEPQFRQLNRQDTDYKKIWNLSSNYSEILEEVYSYIDNPSSEVTIRIDKNKVSIFGTEDLNALSQLESAMESSPTFSTAYIDTLTLEQQEVEQGIGKYILIAVVDDENKYRNPIGEAAQ